MSLTVGALYYHIRENNLPVCQSVGKFRRFDTRELDGWIRNKSSIEMARERRKTA